MKEILLGYLENISDKNDCIIKGYEENVIKEYSGIVLAKEIENLRKYLIRIGITNGDRIIIISEKSPQTIILFFSIWLAGGIAVPICETLKDKELSFIIKDSGAKIIFCADSLEKKLKNLTSIEVTCFSDLKNLKDNNKEEKPLTKQTDPDDTAFIIYTSGSTGNPKGVMLTHRNIKINASTSADYICMKSTDSVMSVLPYWHSFALTAEIFTMLHVGGKIFIPKNKSTFLKDLLLFKPTIVLSIPRLADVLKKGIESSVQNKSSLQKSIFRKAQSVALQYHLTKKNNSGLLLRLLYLIMKKIVFNKIKNNFGGNIKYFIGGGAPLDVSLQKFFLSIDIPMYQGYGLTESSPVISINAPHDFKENTSGKVIPWVRKEHNGDYTFEDEKGKRGKNIMGELLVKGKCVMKGYWNMKEETKKAIIDDWLFTGDMGYIDNESFLVLSGRKKNLLCLKGGEKFYPEFIEERIKSSPYIDHAIIIGEGCKRCYALININNEATVNKTEEDIKKIVEKEIRNLTSDCEPYQRPKRFLILPSFSMEEELLTSTQKIRRHKILEKYDLQIKDLIRE
ncbi:MAG: AMP-binding protein [Candidatus Aureabacteria bacterium]|nr:AMP-binding protein [Candidatus Auribacterota bacterium]